MNIHIIGGGNLGVAIALGITSYTSNNSVSISRRNTQSIQFLEQKGIKVTTSNTQELEKADLVILTVKPYQITSVLVEILPFIAHKVIASAVSGFAIDTIQQINSYLLNKHYDGLMKSGKNRKAVA